ncbi:MAG: hypothetical protein L0H64_22845, partial [Pseudonocardia sp.]|nr:hypothetical protein [Pseudonocardia sp.]
MRAVARRDRPRPPHRRSRRPAAAGPGIADGLPADAFNIVHGRGGRIGRGPQRTASAEWARRSPGTRCERRRVGTPLDAPTVQPG